MYETERHRGSIVVIIDILRASSAICSAFANGVKTIIPVESVGEAREYKKKGYLVAAERDGIILDFADFGNSPFNFTRDKIEGKTVVYSTTNGTGIIKLAASADFVVIGSFLNISALSEWILKKEQDVLLFCAGWKNRFNLEDSVCAGAFAERLTASDQFVTICDSTKAALDLWGLARNDLKHYIDKAAHRSRLKANGLDDCIEFCLTADYTDKIPVIQNGVLVDNILKK